MYKIIDNYLKKEEHLKIKTLLESDSFPWYFSKKIRKKEDIFNHQFIHTFYFNHKINSAFYPELSTLIQTLNPKALVRIKANLNPITQKIVKYGNHVDQNFKCKVAIYYINDNNGYTLIKKEKIESKANRMLFMDSDIEHAGTNTTDTANRMVININYF